MYYVSKKLVSVLNILHIRLCLQTNFVSICLFSGTWLCTIFNIFVVIPYLFRCKGYLYTNAVMTLVWNQTNVVLLSICVFCPLKYLDTLYRLKNVSSEITDDTQPIPIRIPGSRSKKWKSNKTTQNYRNRHYTSGLLDEETNDTTSFIRLCRLCLLSLSMSFSPVVRSRSHGRGGNIRGTVPVSWIEKLEVKDEDALLLV